jgi:hypothetical protein
VQLFASGVGVRWMAGRLALRPPSPLLLRLYYPAQNLLGAESTACWSRSGKESLDITKADTRRLGHDSVEVFTQGYIKAGACDEASVAATAARVLVEIVGAIEARPSSVISSAGGTGDEVRT